MMEREDHDLTHDVCALIGAEGSPNRMYYLGLVAEFERDESMRRRFFSSLLELFVHLDFKEADAERHWERIVRHARAMSAQLGRRIDAHVAILDYFMSSERLLATPVLIEAHDLKRTEKLAMLDGLTGVFNRRYMDMALRKELNRCVRYGKALGLILIDLDDFKRFNDERGHVFGDAALKELARFLKATVREEDLVCRYGGEEFLMILPETDSAGAHMLAERMRIESKDQRFFKENGVTFSGGVSAYPETGIDASEIVLAADKALYQAKFSGKDRIVKAIPERRRYSRFPQAWSIDILDRASRNRSVVTENVSLGGAKIECADPLALDEPLNLQIRPADASSGWLPAQGKVSWIRPKAHEGFDCGLSFIELPREAAELFAETRLEKGA
jgi:two-component system, cell cycle response regulator